MNKDKDKEIDIESLIYKEPHGVDPRKGDILIAEPLLNQPYFKRSVVLLLEEDGDGGHIGLTLNVPTPVTLQDLFPDWEAGKKVRVYSGGPVEGDRLFMLHTLGDRFDGAQEIAKGLYVGADLNQVMEYIQEEENVEGKMRFFLGYSGWGKNQLATEIINHSWALAQPEDMAEALTGRGNEYWRREVERLGEEYRSWLVIPQNPEEN
ncbi:MAG: YqgE/AlgH family protein [Muribaculaceae bacterium]|nr:YqgE/AlgH family protein [Muribaculaceae bacterium]